MTSSLRIRFWKLDGAGNDFIALDNRTHWLPPPGPERDTLVYALCERKGGVGTDGALILEPPSQADQAHLRMRYHNRDGHEAEMCGNGARCMARFAHFLQAAPPEDMRIETLGGLQRADVLDNDAVRLYLPDVNPFRRIQKLQAGPWCGDLDFGWVGVPHSVVWVDDLERVDVNELGRAIRQHQTFSPHGTNVNFSAVGERNASENRDQSAGPRVRVRTYERGVERETLACGTGSVATAISAVAAGRVVSPVPVVVRGGDCLMVDLELDDRGGARNLSLTGPARLLFQAETQWHPDFKTLSV
jgi:diaminopimelate epimerase